MASDLAGRSAMPERGSQPSGAPPSPRASPAATPVGGPAGVVGRPPVDTGRPLNSLSEIKGYQPETAVVLTVSPPLELTPAQRRVAVALEVAGRVVVVWSGLQEDRRTFSDLIALLQRQNFAVSARYTASADRIATIYEGAGINAPGGEIDAGTARMDEVVDQVFLEALKRRASDIHIHCKPTGTVVHFRVDGQMTRFTSEAPAWGVRLARGLFTRGDHDTKQIDFRPSVPQSMTITRRIRIPGQADPVELRLRFQSTPTFPSSKDHESFNAILRVIVMGRDGVATPLPALGFLKPHVYGAITQLDASAGLTILIGATGSGKSTTLQSMVDHLDKRFPTQNILSVEDPPEYPMAAQQIPVVVQDGPLESEQARVQAAFIRTLKAAMRMDPDTVLIGEIRDPPSAQLAMNAALTGHRVLTTFHASSLVHCIQRLVTNGLPPDVLGSEGFLRSIISQSLIPLLCPHCSTPIDKIQAGSQSALSLGNLRDRLARLMDLDAVRVRGGGCSECENGLRGRAALVEMMVPDMRMLSLISESRWLLLSHYWAVSRLIEPSSVNVAAGLTKLEHGLHMVATGKVCPVILDGYGVGKIGERIPVEDRLMSLRRADVIDQGEYQAAIGEFEARPFFNGLGPGAARGFL